MFTELLRSDENCISPGQCEELIVVATSDKSDYRLALVGALCSKYQNEIVDHLLSSMGSHTLAYMTRVARECDLPNSLLSRLMSGSLPFFSKAENDAAKVACCEFVTQIMKNFTEKDDVMQKPFAGTFYSLYIPTFSQSVWRNSQNLARQCTFENKVSNYKSKFSEI